MGTSSSKDVPIIFGDFLEYLRRQGFVIGVEHYLRLHRVLNLIETGSTPSDLKTFICPIFATSKAEQEQFYQAFDSFFTIFHTTVTQPDLNESAGSAVVTDARQAKPLVARKWPYAVAATVVLAIIFLIAAYTTRERTTPESQPAVAEQHDAPVANTQEQNDEPRQRPLPGGGGGQAGEGDRRRDPTRVDEPKPADTAVAPEPEQPDVAPPAIVKKSFYQRYKSAIRAGAVLAPLIIFLFYEWYRFNRRNLVLQKQRGKKPPFLWPIKVKAPRARLYDPETFYTATRLMRRRQAGESQRLDLEATVSATIESLGYPSFRYKTETRQPEYLVLIDRASYRDHQAQLYSHLARALERESIFVEIYFYEGDPRLCRSGSGDGIHLEDLKHKYSGHRLLVFGSGEKMIDPITGRLADWTSTFSDWHDRALLTTEPVERWSLREITLAGQFILLPATLDGLLAVVESFDISTAADLREWLDDGVAAPPREFDESGAVEALREYLKEETFQWLCACAVYPELHWDLTLYLGSLACMPESLVREENLLKLARLPWFRAGAMPDELRWELIRELDSEKEKAIREAIIELLETTSPPEETVAADTYQLNLVVQRWLLRRDRKRKREMLRAIKNLPQSRVVRDYTILRFLESSRHSPLDLILPRRLRRIFYQNGVPAFGLKTGVRLAATISLIAVIGLILYRDVFLPAPENPVVQQKTKTHYILLDSWGASVTRSLDSQAMFISHALRSTAFSPNDRVIVRELHKDGDLTFQARDRRVIYELISKPEPSKRGNTNLASAVERALLDAKQMGTENDVLIWLITPHMDSHIGSKYQTLAGYRPVYFERDLYQRVSADNNIRAIYSFAYSSGESVLYLFYHSPTAALRNIGAIAEDVRKKTSTRSAIWVPFGE